MAPTTHNSWPSYTRLRGPKKRHAMTSSHPYGRIHLCPPHQGYWPSGSAPSLLADFNIFHHDSACRTLRQRSQPIPGQSGVAPWCVWGLMPHEPTPGLILQSWGSHLITNIPTMHPRPSTQVQGWPMAVSLDRNCWAPSPPWREPPCGVGGLGGISRGISIGRGIFPPSVSLEVLS